MPYVRRYSKRRTFGRRRRRVPWYNAKYSVKDMAKAAWSGVKYIKGLVNAELYKFDINLVGSLVTTAGYASHFSGIAQGDGDGARTGNSIFCRSVDVNGQLKVNSSGASVQNVRLMLVEDTQQIGDTAIDIATVLGSGGVFGHLNAQNVGRFKILYSRIFTVDDVKQPFISFKIRRIMRHHVRYNGANAADIQKGGLYLLALSEETTNGPTLSYHGRVSYHDN